MDAWIDLFWLKALFSFPVVFFLLWKRPCVNLNHIKCLYRIISAQCMYREFFFIGLWVAYNVLFALLVKYNFYNVRVMCSLF